MRHQREQDTIIVYTLPGCSHCVRAKTVLKRRGLDYQEVDGSGHHRFRDLLVELTGSATVPQIVINGTPVGGADRLARLDRIGLLEAIADREQFPVTRERRRTSPRLVAAWMAERARGRRGRSAFARVQVKLDHAGRIVETRKRIPPKAP